MYRVGWVCTAFMFAANCLGAQRTPLDDALTLVMAVSPALQQRRIEAKAVTASPPWSVSLSVGHTWKETFNEPEGLNTRLALSVPLFDKTRDIEQAKAWQRVADAESALISSFLADARMLVELGTKRDALDEMRRLYWDRLEFYKQLEHDGVIEAVDLWSQAEAAKRSEHAAQQGLVAYQTKLSVMARQYGKDQWMRLRDLLDAHAKQSAHSN